MPAVHALRHQINSMHKLTWPMEEIDFHTMQRPKPSLIVQCWCFELFFTDVIVGAGSTLDGSVLSDTFADVAPPARDDAEVCMHVTILASVTLLY